MVIALIVGAGGFIGAIARYGINSGFGRLIHDQWLPYGTLTVNVIGCLIIGMVAGLIDGKHIGGVELRAFVVVGILGGFTTYSAFGYETINLLRDGNISAAIVNIAAQIVLGLCAVWIGYKLATIA
ncbi:MAG: fluoride efflux transporter CrcB [Dehalococcoidia bacterium]|nr:fluoride efflux transporter CrcB [Dehalococcoidia bacterium]MQG15756.1 fluoride efflux transporter CrcB [SAR202 cluster bacterium]|tara:strand:+ start:5362 stop:5739 length:378 start_codon:yes stop_codon:yes gene_type:complete